jgi:enoyl-CoA hydratase
VFSEQALASWAIFELAVQPSGKISTLEHGCVAFFFLPSSMALSNLRSVLYAVNGRVATITLNRAHRLNAIDRFMPKEIQLAVEHANNDDNVHAIIVTGAGDSFCSGYDLKEYSEGSTVGADSVNQSMPWDPTVDFKLMKGYTDNYFSLWRSYKPTIAKVKGHAVAGGSDIALCCDLVVMTEAAKIGYPPARVWGCPTTAMWVYRVGPEKAKRMLLTGDLITGVEAEKMGLITMAVPASEIDAKVDALCNRIASVPKNQLMMQKMVINQAIENMGLASTQTLATFFDGVTRHSPEGMWFKQRAEESGFAAAVKERDSGEPIAVGVSKPSHRTD